MAGCSRNGKLLRWRGGGVLAQPAALPEQGNGHMLSDLQQEEGGQEKGSCSSVRFVDPWLEASRSPSQQLQGTAYHLFSSPPPFLPPSHSDPASPLPWYYQVQGRDFPHRAEPRFPWQDPFRNPFPLVSVLLYQEFLASNHQSVKLFWARTGIPSICQTSRWQDLSLSCDCLANARERKGGLRHTCM